MAYFIFEGKQVYYEEYGQGKPLVVLCDTNPAQGVPLLESMVPKHFVRIPADRKAEFEAFCEQM